MSSVPAPTSGPHAVDHEQDVPTMVIEATPCAIIIADESVKQRFLWVGSLPLADRPAEHYDYVDVPVPRGGIVRVDFRRSDMRLPAGLILDAHADDVNADTLEMLGLERLPDFPKQSALADRFSLATERAAAHRAEHGLPLVSVPRYPHLATSTRLEDGSTATLRLTDPQAVAKLCIGMPRHADFFTFGSGDRQSQLHVHRRVFSPDGQVSIILDTMGGGKISPRCAEILVDAGWAQTIQPRPTAKP